jgi:ribosomal protein S18 acetylase RimI-like enzyme
LSGGFSARLKRTKAFEGKLRQGSAVNIASAFINLKQPSPQILPASESDLPAIAALAGVIWRAHYPSIISTGQIDYMLSQMYSLEVLREDIRLRAIRYERLLVGGELAGFAAHGPTEQPKLFKLHKIYLHPAWHGQRLGSLLLRYCEQEVFKLGADRLVLTVNKRNSRAIAAYQRNDFAITDSVVTEIGGGFVMDDYVMAKGLNE